MAATCYRFNLSSFGAKFRGLQMDACDSSRTSTVNGTAVCRGNCWKEVTIDSAIDGYYYLSFNAGTITTCTASWWWN